MHDLPRAGRRVGLAARAVGGDRPADRGRDGRGIADRELLRRGASGPQALGVPFARRASTCSPGRCCLKAPCSGRAQSGSAPVRGCGTATTQARPPARRRSGRWRRASSSWSTRSSPASTAEGVGGREAWQASRGLLSVITPCVLPLVRRLPSRGRLSRWTSPGERGSAWRRRLRASLHRGFSTGRVRGACGRGGDRELGREDDADGDRRLRAIVLGFVFVGSAAVAGTCDGAGAARRARWGGSSVLLGGAFAVCAAPCIGTVLASILVLASSSGGVLRG